MTYDKYLLDYSDTVLCHLCQQEISLDEWRLFLDRGHYPVRLRCTHPECGFVDDYNEYEFHVRTGKRAPEQGPGEVWIHDVLLGLSFKVQEDNREKLLDGAITHRR